MQSSIRRESINESLDTFVHACDEHGYIIALVLVVVRQLNESVLGLN